MATSSCSSDRVILKAEIMDLHVDFLISSDMKKEKCLGKGMSGEVALVSFLDDPDDKRAVKFLTKSKENEALFVREVAILQKVSHPNILSNVMAFKCPDSFVLCMSYYPGGSLRQRLPRMPSDRLMQLFLQLTSAVLYLHTLDIAHRDVKPDNVLLDEHDDVILIDFGLACQVKGGRALSRTGGTPGYMPPELFTMMNFDIYKCDMYALGVVLWNLVFRLVPPASTDYLYYVDHNKGIPAVYRTLLKHLLDPDPISRWEDRQLVNALCTFPETSKMAAKLWGRRA